MDLNKKKGDIWIEFCKWPGAPLTSERASSERACSERTCSERAFFCICYLPLNQIIFSSYILHSLPFLKEHNRNAYFAVPRQIVGVLNPAVVGCELSMCSSEVDWGPARDGITYILVHTDKYGEQDEYHDRVARTQPISEIIVV